MGRFWDTEGSGNLEHFALVLVDSGGLRHRRTLHGPHLLTMKVFIVCAALLAAAAAVAPPAISCAGKPEGHTEFGCWGFYQCVGGNLNTVECADTEVLERDSMTCIKAGSGHTDCDKAVDCTGMPDGHYADLGDNCESYFRCYMGQFLGHFFCPMNLYFNEKTVQCDFPANVPQCFPTAAPTAAPVPGR